MSRARLGGRSRSRANRSRTSGPPQVVRHTRLDHGRAIAPVPLPQTFFSLPQGYRSLEGVFTELSVSSRRRDSSVNAELSMSSEKHLLLVFYFLNTILRTETLADGNGLKSRFQ